MEDINLNEFNMIKGINKLKTLAKHISCERRCKFDGRNVSRDKNGTYLETKMEQCQVSG